MKSRDIRTIVLNIVIVALVFLNIVIGGVAIDEVRSFLRTYREDESGFLYALDAEDYDLMLDYYYQNCGSDGKEDKKLQEYYDIAKYYEAAFYYKIHMDAGDVERAAKYQAIMDEISARVGEFAFALEDIDKRFAEY